MATDKSATSTAAEAEGAPRSSRASASSSRSTVIVAFSLAIEEPYNWPYQPPPAQYHARRHLTSRTP